MICPDLNIKLIFPNLRALREDGIGSLQFSFTGNCTEYINHIR